MKIKKNDKVLVMKGKDSGKTGKVEKVIPNINKIVVAGLNKYKRSSKPTKANPQGGIMDIYAPISLANVKIICPRCNKATSVKYNINQKNKTRICKKCKETLEVK